MPSRGRGSPIGPEIPGKTSRASEIPSDAMTIYQEIEISMPHFADEEQVKLELLEDHARLRSWHKVSLLSKYCGMPKSTCHAVATKNYHVPREYADQMGLPRLALARVCPIHGVVHVRKTCPTSETTKPSLQMSISTCNPRSAALSITARVADGRLSYEFVEQLSDELTAYLLIKEN